MPGRLARGRWGGRWGWTGRQKYGTAVQIGVDRYSRCPLKVTVDCLLCGSGLEVSRGICFTQLERGGRETTGMGRCHGCLTDGIGGGGATIPGCLDGNAWCVDVNAGPLIGEQGRYVAAVGGTDGDGFARGCRGVIACICVTISGCIDEGDSFVDGVGNSSIH